jgi:hypothetical protein
LLRYRLAITALSLRYRLAIASLSTRYRLAIASLSLRYRLAIAALSPRYRLAIAIASLSLRYRLAIALVSPWYCLTIVSPSPHPRPTTHHTVLFPGSLSRSTYSLDTFDESRNARLIFIPHQSNNCSSSGRSAPSSIPALLVMCPSATVNKMVIHFHGNACDARQIQMCGERESKAFDAHYLIVEYPRYGLSDGLPNECVINDISRSVFRFVSEKLRVPAQKIVLIGRSIGSGPVCVLASELQKANTPVAAVILQSPYTSIRVKLS